MERRLTAILAADVVGYSRLMGTNETGTLAALKTVQTDFIDGKIAEHQGRIVKLTGVYSVLGDIKQAFDLLERLLPYAGHELKHGWIKHDSDLDPLRSHPRYQKVLELIG